MSQPPPLGENVCRELLDAAPDAMIVIGRAGGIVLTNSLADGLFGYGERELIGRPAAVLMPERFRARHESHQARFFQAPVRRPMGAGMELLGLRKNGEEFPTEVSLSPLRTPEGLFAISAIRDISERKRAADKLERMNRELIGALELVKQLSGILPICSFCKKIRDERGAWKAIETYVHEHSEATFTHGLCPDCGRRHYGEDFSEGT